MTKIPRRRYVVLAGKVVTNNKVYYVFEHSGEYFVVEAKGEKPPQTCPRDCMGPFEDWREVRLFCREGKTGSRGLPPDGAELT